MGSALKVAAQLIILLLHAHSANLEISVHPKDTEAMVGKMTWLNCSTSGTDIGLTWYHYPVGSALSTYIYIYRKLQSPYDERFKVEKHQPGTFNLIILTVEPRDAGSYVCQEDGEDGTLKSAQLIVLDGELSFVSNIDANGVIGNKNWGIEPEELELQCSVKYHGNIPPILEWRKNGNNNILKDGVFKKVHGGLVTSILKMTGSLEIDGSSYVCQTTRSAINQYAHASDVIRILYAFSDFTVVHKTEGDVVTCKANSNSLTCAYKWKWLNGNNEETISDQPTVTLTRKGTYKCESECKLKNKLCLLTAKLVDVSTFQASTEGPNAENRKEMLAIILPTVLVTVIVTCLCLALVVYRLTARKRRLGEVSSEELVGLNVNNQETEPSSDISGLATIDNEVFISHYSDKYIEVYDLTTFKFKNKWPVEKLAYPGDMDSDKTWRLLYIFDISDDNVSSRIIQLNKAGKYIREWKTEFDGGALSVTYDNNIVLVAFSKNKLIEYTHEGRLLREMDLSQVFSGISPWHAVKIAASDFVICYGLHNYNKQHRVVKVRYNGVKNSEENERCVDMEELKVFGSDEALSKMKMNVPIRLVVQNDCTIIVADQHNARVFKLNSDFEFDVDIISKQRLLIRPRRMCLDKESQRLIVSDHTKVLIWNLDESQGQWLDVKHKTE